MRGLESWFLKKTECVDPIFGCERRAGGESLIQVGELIWIWRVDFLKRSHIWTWETWRRCRPLIRAPSRAASKHHYTGAAATITSLPQLCCTIQTITALPSYDSFPLSQSSLLSSTLLTREILRGEFSFLPSSHFGKITTVISHQRISRQKMDFEQKWGVVGSDPCHISTATSFAELHYGLFPSLCRLFPRILFHFKDFNLYHANENWEKTDFSIWNYI